MSGPLAEEMGHLWKDCYALDSGASKSVVSELSPGSLLSVTVPRSLHANSLSHLLHPCFLLHMQTLAEGHTHTPHTCFFLNFSHCQVS